MATAGLTPVITVCAMLKDFLDAPGDYRCFEDAAESNLDYRGEAVWCSSMAAQEPDGGVGSMDREARPSSQLLSQPAEHLERIFQARRLGLGRHAFQGREKCCHGFKNPA